MLFQNFANKPNTIESMTQKKELQSNHTTHSILYYLFFERKQLKFTSPSN